MRLTNISGKTEPLALEVPDVSAGQTPDTGKRPFLPVNLSAWLENYEQIDITGIQIFPNVVTTQNLEMVPLPELPENWNGVEDFNTPPQNL